MSGSKENENNGGNLDEDSRRNTMNANGMMNGGDAGVIHEEFLDPASRAVSTSTDPKSGGNTRSSQYIKVKS